MNVLESITKTSQNYRNLSTAQYKALSSLKSRTDIVIKPADKNIGISVTEKNTYIELCNEHLKDTSVYKPLNYDPLDTTIRKLKCMIHNLLDHKLITIEQHNQILPNKDNRIGLFYALMKLHKEKLSIRPIVSQIRHPTRNLSQFIHETLQPTAMSAKTFISNSYELKKQLEKIPIGPDTCLISGDISSLYTNIPTQEGIDNCIESYTNNDKDNTKINTTALRQVLYNTLSQNVFLFNNNFYQQIKGTAMGTIMAPTYANCYLRNKEEKWLEKEPLVKNVALIKRYIDDILIIYDNSQKDVDNLIDNFKKAYEPLELNIKTSTSEIEFLDILIKINHLKKSLDTSVYHKPIGRSQLIPHNSNHPKHMLYNIIANESLRTHRLSQNTEDIKKEKMVTLARALEKGYDLNKIKKALKPKNQVKRLQEKDKKYIMLTYSQQTDKLKESLQNSWKTHSTKNPCNTDRLNIGYRLNKSIRKAFVHPSLN